MSAHPPIPSVPDPVPPPEEGSLVTFLALLDDCEREDAHPISECGEASS
jgi:hypothetical protein